MRFLGPRLRYARSLHDFATAAVRTEFAHPELCRVLHQRLEVGAHPRPGRPVSEEWVLESGETAGKFEGARPSSHVIAVFRGMSRQARAICHQEALLSHSVVTPVA